MRNSILAIAMVLLLFVAVAYGTQLCSQEPFSEAFGFSSEDFGGGSYLGVDTRDITSDRLSDLKLKEEHGVEVTLVDQDAPAGKAGLKEHDVILTINGNQVESVEQLRRMIREIPPGRMVTLGISRDGQPLTLKAQLADRKKTFALATPGKAFTMTIPNLPTMPMMPVTPLVPEMDVPVSIVVVHSSARSGLMVENLTPQLGDFFGAKNGQGVLVRSVEKGSRAEKAGFRAGDVIVKVNGESISDSGDFTRAVRGRKNSTVNVSIIREKKEQNLTLALPEHNQSELLDESLEGPALDEHAETVIDLEAQSEVARITPEVERAVRGIRLIKPSLAEAARELRHHQKEWNQEMRELERALRDKEVQNDEEIQQQDDKMQENLEYQIRQPGADI
jgi:membrane-associated protease RseP (regulator of RpoE activity)